MTESAKKWYTVHVYSSMEKSVKKALEERIARSELRDSFGEVLLPIEKVREIRNGRKMTTERRLYPGYVFIEMEMNDATWHLVNSTPRVIEFLGNNNPVVLSDSEVAAIRQIVETGAENRNPRLNLRSVKKSESNQVRSKISMDVSKKFSMTRAVCRSWSLSSVVRPLSISTLTKSKKSKKRVACSKKACYIVRLST